MDPYMPMENSTALLPWVRLLQLLKDANPKQALDNALLQVAPPILASVYEAAIPERPGFYYAQLNGPSFLLIDGATTLQQAIFLTGGYTGPAIAPIPNPVNSYLTSGAQLIVDFLRARYPQAPTNLRIGGYSTGGAIAPIIPWTQVNRNWGDGRGNVITFGAPKVCGFRHTQELDVNGRCTRIMNVGDPVPLFCPSALDYPQIIAIIGLAKAARLSNFVHPGRGTILDADGRLTSGTLPDVGAVEFGAQLATWFNAVEGDGTNQHALNEYERRLTLMQQRNDRAFHVPQGQAPQNVQVPPKELNQREREVINAVARAGAVQGHEPVILPVEKIFYWQKVGGIHCVGFGDKLVTITSTKRKAKRLANAGNDFLRVLQRQAVVDPIAMTSQFENYFVFAAGQGFGFRPIMNTVFPAIGN